MEVWFRAMKPHREEVMKGVKSVSRSVNPQKTPHFFEPVVDDDDDEYLVIGKIMSLIG